MKRWLIYSDDSGERIAQRDAHSKTYQTELGLTVLQIWNWIYFEITWTR